MPARSRHGSEAAILDLVVGFIVSAIISSIGGKLEGILLFVVSVASAIALIELLSRMNYWSLTYLIGWIIGIFVFGQYLLPKWEFRFYMVVSIGYAIVKLLRRR